MIVLYFDSDMDITPVEAKKYGAKIISMPYVLDSQEVHPYRDDEKFDFHKFYQTLRDGAMPSTAALNVDEYKAIFEPEFKAGNDILYVHFSAAMSCTFDNMHQALDELKKQYPNVKFYEFDTKAITLLSYVMAIHAGEMYKAGKTPTEIIAELEKERDHYACYFYADNLNFFRLSGRVSGLAAIFGNLLGIHPIMNINAEGKMGAIGKVRGKNQALKALVDYVDKLGDDVKKYPFYIAHADAMPLAETLIRLLQEKYGQDLQPQCINVNPTAGSHCGPDTVGVVFHSIHR